MANALLEKILVILQQAAHLLGVATFEQSLTEPWNSLAYHFYSTETLEMLTFGTRESS